MFYTAVGFIAALSFVLGLHALGSNSLWLDEGLSAGMARLPLTDFLKLSWRRDANMGVYFLLLRAWTIVGSSEFILRLLSVAFSTASVVAVGGLARRLFGTQAGTMAALLLALNAFNLRYAQEVRGYSLLILLVTLSTYFFVRMLELPSTWNKRLYLTTSALAFYTHFFSLLVTVAQFIALALWNRERFRREPLVKTGAFVAAIYAPGILFLLFRNRGQLDWVPAPTWTSFYDFLLLFTGQGGLWLLLAYAAICAPAVWSLLRPKISGEENQGFACGLAAAWLVLPIAALLAASIVKPIFVPRYTTMSLPGLILLATGGSRRLLRIARSGAVLLLVVLAAGGVRNYFAGVPAEGEQWRELTRFVVGKSSAGDGVIFDNGVARPVFDYYQAGAKWPQVLFPAHGEKLTYRDFEGIATPQIISSASTTSQRVWLVTRLANPALELAMLESFTKIDEREFRGAKVQLYVRR